MGKSEKPIRLFFWRSRKATNCLSKPLAMTNDDRPLLQIKVEGLPGTWIVETHWEKVDNLEIRQIGPRNPEDRPTLVLRLTPLDDTATQR